MIKLLKERVAKGVKVRVLGDMKGKDPGIEERRLAMRLHVRAIVRDGKRAFVGSQSLRKDELENRREVGLIINNPAVAKKSCRCSRPTGPTRARARKRRPPKSKRPRTAPVPRRSSGRRAARRQ